MTVSLFNTEKTPNEYSQSRQRQLKQSNEQSINHNRSQVDDDAELTKSHKSVL